MKKRMKRVGALILAVLLMVSGIYPVTYAAEEVEGINEEEHDAGEEQGDGEESGADEEQGDGEESGADEEQGDGEESDADKENDNNEESGTDKEAGEDEEVEESESVEETETAQEPVTDEETETTDIADDMVAFMSFTEEQTEEVQIMEMNLEEYYIEIDRDGYGTVEIYCDGQEITGDKIYLESISEELELMIRTANHTFLEDVSVESDWMEVNMESNDEDTECTVRVDMSEMETDGEVDDKLGELKVAYEQHFDDMTQNDEMNLTKNQEQNLTFTLPEELVRENLTYIWEVGDGVTTSNKNKNTATLKAVQNVERSVAVKLTVKRSNRTILKIIQMVQLYKDTTAPVLTEYTIQETDGAVLQEQGDMIRTDRNLNVTLHAEDAIGAGEHNGSGLDKVVVYRGETRMETVSFEDGDLAVCSIQVADGAEEQHTYSFEIYDRAGNYSTVLTKDILIDHKKPSLLAKLGGADNWTTASNQGWYSETVHGKNTLQLQMEAGDLSGVTRLEIYKRTQGADSLFQTIEEPQLVGNTYTASVTMSGEQNTELFVKAYDAWNHASEKQQVWVRIDNTAPKKEAIVQFAGTEEMVVRPEDGFQEDHSYVISSIDGRVYDKRQITLRISSADKTGTAACVSGIADMSYNLVDVDTQDSETQSKLFPYNQQGEGNHTEEQTAQQLLTISDGEEHSYQIRDLRITDYAGNTTKLSETDILDDKVIYALDNKAPEVIYEHGDAVTAAGSDVLYYRSGQTGKVTVTDRNIDVEHASDTIKVKNLGHTNAEIISSSLSEKMAAYNLKMNADGRYHFETTAVDILGNGAGSVFTSPTYVVDTTAPAIQITYARDGVAVTPAGSSQSYYNGQITATITITDANMDLASIQVQVLGKDDAGNSPEFALNQDTWTASGEADGSDVTYTNTVTFNRDGAYSLAVSCQDIVGWTASESGQSFTIDTKAPQVRIAYNHTTPVNDIYYNVTRKATVSVQDFTFDESSADYDITSYPHAPDIGGWSHTAADGCDGTTHVATCTFESVVDFNEDGEYEFAFSCKDKAGNESGKTDDEHFVIDTTAPVMTVTFDNQDVRNERYYRAARVATISIDDMTFSSDLFSITKTGEAGINDLPAISGWTTRGTMHTATVHFQTDGIFAFTMQCADLAENAAQEYRSETFVIDMTAPQVTFGGVSNYSANNSTVAPSLTYTDTNIDLTADAIVVKGANHGEVNWNATVTDITNGKQIVYPDVAHSKEMDDMYTITAGITDLAGNETEEELVFSVNRYGSVYVVDEATQRVVADYYTGVAPQVAVTEINIDELTMREVTVSRDGETSTLRQGQDYQVNQQGTDMSWKSYTYILPAANFAVDGNYAITLYSQDKATNTSDNRMKGSEITFAVDTTPPSVVVDGIESESIYEESRRTITIDAKDNMYLTGVTVYKNGMMMENYDEEALEQNSGVMSFTLEEEENAQNIEIRAQDLVNNQQVLNFDHVWISTKTTVIEEAETARAETFVKEIKQTASKGIFFIVIGGIFCGGAVGGTVIYKKKKAVGIEKK